MRLITFITLRIPGLSYAGTANATSDNYRMKSGKLNGNWVPVKQEMGGTLLSMLLKTKSSLLVSALKQLLPGVDKSVVKCLIHKINLSANAICND